MDGTLYQIATQPELLADCVDKTDAPDISCKQVSEPVKKQSLNNLYDDLRKADFNTQKISTIPNCYMIMGTNDKYHADIARKNYMKTAYDELTAKLRDLTLDEFAKDSGLLAAVESLLENKQVMIMLTKEHGDIVMTLDQFIRTIEPGKEYYVNADVCLFRNGL